jgi:hypothetical protein
MSTVSRPLLRLALAIHNQVNSRADRLFELPHFTWHKCELLARQHRRAHLRGWHLAAGALSRELGYFLTSAESELGSLRERLPRSPVSARRVTSTEIYTDLLTLRQEFACLDYDLVRHTMSVTTEAIHLQGVYLGPFEIRLVWSHLSNGSTSYRVVAKDPHPAQGRENVTHPHVQDEVLCEGDGRHAIRLALSQGRLLDFFTLIAAVLRSYNAESPFVELSLWNGTSCTDCGSFMEENEEYSCRRCGTNICSECETACCGCNSSCCSNCIGACSGCDDQFCARCLTNCRGCRTPICEGCLDQDERCPTCHEEQSHEICGPRHAADGTTIQSHGLGEAALPA